MLDILKRPTDTLVRYSENELAVLLPDTSALGAKHIVKKVLTSVAELKSKDADLTCEKIDFPAGMSSMVAVQKITNLIELVDKNLLQNKQTSHPIVSRYYITQSSAFLENSIYFIKQIKQFYSHSN
jgi:PleD family two-component response regulator